MKFGRKMPLATFGSERVKGKALIIVEVYLAFPAS